MEKNLANTKTRYSEQILPVPWPFVIWGSIVLNFCQDLLEAVQRLLESVSATRPIILNESNNKKGNAYKSSQLAGVFLGVTETVVVSLLAPYLEY